MKRRSVLLGIAVVLAGFSAIVHLGIGIEGLIASLTTGSTPVLPVLFLGAAGVVTALLVALARGRPVAPTVFLLGGVLMIAHLFAYADAHAFGMFESATGVDMHGQGYEEHDHDGHDHNGDHGSHDHTEDDGHGHADHDHDDPAHEVLLGHLRDDLAALSTKIAEAGSAIAFFALYALER